MALDSARLSTAIKTLIGAKFTVGDEAELQKLCDSIAEAVVQEIQANAEVTVTGVTAGGATAPGTVT